MLATGNFSKGLLISGEIDLVLGNSLNLDTHRQVVNVLIIWEASMLIMKLTLIMISMKARTFAVIMFDYFMKRCSQTSFLFHLISPDNPTRKGLGIVMWGGGGGGMK